MIPHARNDDPITSHAAAARVGEFTQAHMAIIRASLLGDGPGTYEEVARRTGLRPDQVWRRLSDMDRRGLAAPTGDYRPGSAGRLQRIWRAA